MKSLIATNIILYCQAWDATLRFYRDGLQLPVLFSNDWFMEFALTETSRLSLADEKHASIKSCKPAGVTLTLQVQDLDVVWDFTASMGLQPTEIRNHPWNARIFHLFDPEGHRIEIWQILIQTPGAKIKPP